MRYRTTCALAGAIALCYTPYASAQQVPLNDDYQNETEAQIQQGEQRIQQDNQRIPQGEQRTANFRGADAGQSGDNVPQQAKKELVYYLAAKLMLANQCQIEIATMAAEKANNQQVVEFANTMKMEHEQLNQRLKEAMPKLKAIQSASFATNQSPGLGSTTENQFQDPTTRRPTTRNGIPQQPPASSTTSPANQQVDPLEGAAQTLIDITRRSVENNFEATQEMLSQKQGEEFDRCYIGMEIVAHTLMISELKAVQDVGPQEFTSIVTDAEQKLATHLSKAKQIAKEFEQGYQTSSRATELRSN